MILKSFFSNSAKSKPSDSLKNDFNENKNKNYQYREKMVRWEHT